jgi:anhydro-N-acetylmuramic acid kinase
MQSNRILIGAMSGTSADGVDVAIVRIGGRGLEMTVQLIRHDHCPYDSHLKKAIFALRDSGKTDLKSFAKLGHDITLVYAAAIHESLLASKLSASDVAAIAAHGQTLFHEPPLTIQWLDPSLLAARVNCAVVSDFRRADCAAGGQGAPLVPFADYILFRHPQIHRILLNIGGIANFTYLPPAGRIDQLVALDTGPGNCISDWICRTRAVEFGWDVDGAGASRGKLLAGIAEAFLTLPYFSAPGPKSTDGPTMIDAFDRAIGKRDVEMNDLLATAAYVTAATITQAISCLARTAADNAPWEVIASGGGTKNKSTMGQVRSMLDARIPIRTTSDAGVLSDAKEAVAFAILGAATLDGEPSNIPSVTGATSCVVLGSITPRPA